MTHAILPPRLRPAVRAALTAERGRHRPSPPTPIRPRLAVKRKNSARSAVPDPSQPVLISCVWVDVAVPRDHR
jgi:hypothetical protein